MKIKDIAPLMYDNNENQYVCMQDFNENVLFIGTLADLERNFPKSLNAEILQMYTERYPAFNNVSGLTIVVQGR